MPVTGSNSKEFQLYSRSLSQTRREVPHDASSINHELLMRGGFVSQESAGIYTMLPLGERVVKNIEEIIRNGMQELGAEEVTMPILQAKENWVKTGRWDTVDVLYRLKSRWSNREYGLAPTAEEAVVPVAKNRIQSYKDLPLAIFQIQKKFRDEKRAKSGVIRGREFGMKDMYSFHATPEDFQQFYKRTMDMYLQIFDLFQLNAKVTEASGGEYTTQPTHEFHAISDAGEDTIVHCTNCTFAQNSEISQFKHGDSCPHCQAGLEVNKSIEIGHIFDLGVKFTEAFDLTFVDHAGHKNPIFMGCYGIGTTRAMASVVELHHDEKGIIWPDAIAPYNVHLIGLNLEQESVQSHVSYLLNELKDRGVSVLYDDRTDAKVGDKFATADLIGIPNRIVVSPRTIEKGVVEFKRRDSKDAVTLPIEELLQTL